MRNTQLMERFTKALNEKIAKGYRNGAHRAVAPDETVARIRPLMAEFGITRVANVTGLDWLGIPVVMVCRPNSRSLSVSQGKGLTLDAAKASGLMETIELHYAERIALPVKVGSFRELSKSHTVVEVDQLPLVNHSRYHEQRELLWVEGYDLLQDQPMWVPYEYVSTNGVSLDLPGRECFLPTSNGLASGNHLLEAIAHAVCEVVERDATTLWYQSERRIQKSNRLDLDSCDDLNCRQLIARCHAAGIQALAWETTSDIGLPSFLCLLHEGNNDPSRLLYSSVGMGCHVSRGIALVRAITEAAQTRLTLITGSRDDVFRNQYEQSRFRDKDLMQYCSLRPSNGKYRHFKEIPSFERETFNEDISWILERLQSVGIKHVIVVTLTEAESDFHVVKAVIPGLEGPDDHSEYSPGLRAQRLKRLPS